jgi:hypothetical protein
MVFWEQLNLSVGQPQRFLIFATILQVLILRKLNPYAQSRRSVKREIILGSSSDDPIVYNV